MQDPDPDPEPKNYLQSQIRSRIKIIPDPQHRVYHASSICMSMDVELSVIFCRHAMANCFEALLGAIFLDGGIDVADKVFSDAMFGSGTLSKENRKEQCKGRLSCSSVLHFLNYIDCDGTQKTLAALTQGIIAQPTYRRLPDPPSRGRPARPRPQPPPPPPFWYFSLPALPFLSFGGVKIRSQR